MTSEITGIRYNKMVKKILFFITMLMVTTTVRSINFDRATGGEKDPYLIKNETDLRELATLVNENRERFENKHFRLETDIELSDKPWIPIGVGGVDVFFSGIFDGNHKKIKCLYAKGSDAGLFGGTNKATIKNTGIIISSKGIIGERNAGGLVARSYGDTITGCYVTGEGVITATNIHGRSGGLIGFCTMSTIISCYSTVEVGGNNDAGGGLIGYIWNGRIYDSFASGDITGYHNSSGGLMGYSHNCTINCCYAAGEIIGNYREAGGLSAENIGGHITNCYFNSDNKGLKSVSEDYYGITSAKGISRLEMATNGLNAMPDLTKGSGNWYDVASEKNALYFPSPINVTDQITAFYKIKNSDQFVKPETKHTATPVDIPAPISEPAVTFRVVPGYESAGLHLDNLPIVDRKTFSGEVQFRELPNGEWQKAIEMVLAYQETSARSVLVNLKENSSYEAQVTYRFDGKSQKMTTPFSTKKLDVPIAKTIVLDETNFKDHLYIGESGTAEGYIRYTAKPGFVLKGMDSYRETVWLDAVDYIILDGLTIQGPSFNGITIRGCTNIQITNCNISHFGSVRTETFDNNADPNLDEGKVVGYQAGICLYEVKDLLIERNYIHDPNGRANSWFYSHPAGPTAIFAGRAASTTLRFNDLIGSDLHRWNDTNEGWENGAERGSYYMDAEIYGNHFAFANDDAIELDGGQANSRFFRNKSEGGICGISTASCNLGPSYIFENVICNPGDEFGFALNAIKNNFAMYGKGRIYIFNNILVDFPCGISGFGKGELTPELRKELKLVTRNNISHCERIFRYDVPDFTVDLDYDWIQENDPSDLKKQEKHRISGIPVLENAEKGDFRPTTRPVGAVIPNFCVDGKVGTNCIIPFRPIPVETSVAQMNFMSDGAPQRFTVKVTDQTFQGRFKMVLTSETDYLQITPTEGDLKSGQDVQITVSILPDKIKQARMNHTTILVRMENGMSRPVSVYVDSRQDMKKVKNDRKNVIFGNITQETDLYSITFDVPEDGRYYFFIQGSPTEASPTILINGEQKADWMFYGQPGTGCKWCVLGRNLGLNQPEILKAGRHTLTIRKDGKTEIMIRNAALAKTPEEIMLAVFTDQ